MKISFSEAFIDKHTDRTLSLNYLKKNNFSARMIFGPLGLEDLTYFDETTGSLPNNFYSLYHAQWGDEEDVITVGSVVDLFEQCRQYNLEDKIIEYSGKNFFIWDVESECYVIFGDRRMVSLVSDPAYSPDVMRKIIENLNSEPLKIFLMDFYEKYNFNF